jgi:hypothetical protein
VVPAAVDPNPVKRLPMPPRPHLARHRRGRRRGALQGALARSIAGHRRHARLPGRGRPRGCAAPRGRAAGD